MKSYLSLTIWHLMVERLLLLRSFYSRPKYCYM